MAAQDVNITIEDGALGVLPPAALPMTVKIGCSTAGAVLTPLVTTDPKEIISTYGEGPLVQGALFELALTGAPIMVIRSTTGTPGSSGTLTFSGTGTSVVTKSGNPADKYGVIFEVVTGGTIGVAGITWKVSLDNGQTYGPVKPLGVANTLLLTTASGASTGVTLNFAAGTLVAGDKVDFQCVAPVSSASDVALGMQAVIDSDYEVDHWHVLQISNASDCTTYTLKTTAAASAFRYLYGLYESRDLSSGESLATWKAALISDFSAFADLRSSIAAGYYLTTSPLDGNKIRRSLAWTASARSINIAIARELGAVVDGSLKGIEGPKDDGNIYYDERTSPGLDAARFMVARTLIGKKGYFVMNSNIMCQPGSDFDIIPNRRVMDKACSTTHFVCLDYLNLDVRVNPETGFILEKDRVDVQNRIKQALVDTLVSTGNASSVSVIVAGNDNILSTRTLTVTIRIVPLGYIKSISITIGFSNPANQVAA